MTSKRIKEVYFIWLVSFQIKIAGGGTRSERWLNEVVLLQDLAKVTVSS